MLFYRLAAKKRRRPAAAAVEFALLLPLLLFLFVIAVDYARVFYYAVTVTNAARNGAIWGSFHPDRAGNKAGIAEVALADTTNLQPTPTVDSTTGFDDAGDPYVRVTVAWTFHTVIPYPGVPQEQLIQRTVQMRVAPPIPKND
jgi:Flp pilus assembly protein TadG